MDIHSFITYIQTEKRFSDHTVRSYELDITQFVSFLNNRDLVSTFSEVKPLWIREWIMELSEMGMSHRTINRKISSLTTLFNYLRKIGEIEVSPMKSISRLKQPKRIVEALKTNEIEFLFSDNLYSTDYAGVLDKTILMFFYFTGVRRQELIDLVWENVDLGSDVLKVFGKRKKERLIPIHPQLKQQIQSFVKVREQVHGNQRGSFFLLEDGRTLTPKLVYDRVNSYLSMTTSIDKKSPHLMRHTFATHLLNQGADLNTIKELLGHANLSATEIYTHNSINKIKSVYNQAHPRGGSKKK